jgi:hypothetical protein
MQVGYFLNFFRHQKLTFNIGIQSYAEECYIPPLSADIAWHPVTSREKSCLRGVLGNYLNENLGQVGNAQNNY